MSSGADHDDGRASDEASESAAKQSRRRAMRRRGSIWSYTFGSLAIPGYRLLWFAVLFWVAGGHMQSIVRSYLAYELTGSARVLAVITDSPSDPPAGASPLRRSHRRPARTDAGSCRPVR